MCTALSEDPCLVSITLTGAGHKQRKASQEEEGDWRTSGGTRESEIYPGVKVLQ